MEFTEPIRPTDDSIFKNLLTEFDFQGFLKGLLGAGQTIQSQVDIPEMVQNSRIRFSELRLPFRDKGGLPQVFPVEHPSHAVKDCFAVRLQIECFLNPFKGVIQFLTMLCPHVTQIIRCGRIFGIFLRAFEKSLRPLEVAPDVPEPIPCGVLEEPVNRDGSFSSARCSAERRNFKAEARPQEVVAKPE